MKDEFTVYGTEKFLTKDGKYKICIERDSCDCPPFDFDYLGTIYTVSDEADKTLSALEIEHDVILSDTLKENNANLISYLDSMLKDTYVLYPVKYNEYSNNYEFQCYTNLEHTASDDYDMYIVFENKRMLANGYERTVWQEAACRSAEDRFRTYNQFFSGEVYYAVLYKLKTCEACGHTEEISMDSVGGLYPDKNDCLRMNDILGFFGLDYNIENDICFVKE